MIARAPQAPRNLVLSARLGLVSVPETLPGAASPAAPQEDGTGFDRIQARDLLASLGRGLGLTLLAPSQDTFPESAPAAPLASDLDPAVRLTLEGLDAVWMAGGELVAAFVVEPRACGFEGLRRLADLLALHPKLKAPLYAVTMPALEAGILAEVHRPAYRLMKKPLAEMLRLLDWDRLRTEVEQLGERVRYLKPEFLEGISERLAPPAEE